MSDQDLDAVLERGAKRTHEMQAKLNVSDKGDMLDFSFDDGSGVQVWRGNVISYVAAPCGARLRSGPRT